MAHSEKTIEVLQRLIRLNLDSTSGFEEAARTIASPSIATLFRTLATERRANAEELKGYVRVGDETPADSGTVGGAMQRWWLKVRGTLSGGDDYAVLAEAERGEDSIKHGYERALADTVGAEVNAVITRQYQAIKDGHDRVRNLRDMKKAVH